LNKDIKDFTDLELAEALGNSYRQLMMVDQQITIVNAEIERRKVTLTEATSPSE
jgi:hypothetical protein